MAQERRRSEARPRSRDAEAHARGGRGQNSAPAWEFVQVMTAAPDREVAGRIAAAVVEARLAACAQVSGPIESTYWWEGRVEKAEEWYVVMKTRAVAFARLEEAIRRLHPYQTPEIIATPIVAGSKAYLDWIRTSTRSVVG